MIEPSVKTTPYENIALSYRLIINIKSDYESGYTVNINGKDYSGENAGYSNSDMTDIDLSALRDIPEGHRYESSVCQERSYIKICFFYRIS